MANPSLIKQKLFPRAFLLLTLILSCALTSRAGTDFTYNGLNYTTLTDNTCETKQGSNSTGTWVAGNSVSGDIVIPEIVYDGGGNAYIVTKIGMDSFYKLSDLTSVTIPNSVTEIGGYAFRYCTGLTEIIIPNSVTEIGSYAFNGCTGVTDLNITDSETKLTIGSSAFTNVKPTKAYLGRDISSAIFTSDTKLSDLTIGDKVTAINASEFSGCTGVTDLNITDSETKLTIGGSAFTNVKPSKSYLGRDISRAIFTGDTKLSDLTIGDKVTAINASEFSGCTGITKLNIADSETKLTIGNEAFTNVKPTKVYLGRNISSAIFTSDTKLSDLTIGDKVTAINASEFSGCTGLTSVAIPNSVTSIGDYAFQSCTELTSVSIPETVTSLGNWTFDKCEKLESVNIPNSVTSIGEHTFGACTGLTSVTIPSSVTSIGSNAFYGCTGLTSVTIPSSVTSIGSSAFSGCTGLTSVTIPSSVTSIGSNAFYGCTGLVKSAYPNSISKPFSNGVAVPYPTDDALIEDGFIWSSDKTELYFVPFDYPGEFVIPNSVTSIGDYAFQSCTELTSVSIPETVTSLGNWTFDKCAKLESVNIPSSVTSIGEHTFGACTGLTSLIIGNSVTSIGGAAFYGCTGVTELNIADSETKLTIGGSAFTSVKPTKAYLGRDISSAIFTNDTNLSDLTIGDKVTAINGSEFYGCTGLTSVTIPNSVTSIGEWAFYGCTGLTSVTIPNSVTSIGYNAFRGCTGLTSVTIPDLVTSIGSSAFYGCTGLQWIESKATTPPTITEDTFSDYNVPLIAASEDYKTADYWKNFTNMPAEYTPTGRTFEVDGLKYEIIDVNDCTCRLYGINESVEGDVVIPATVTYREREFTPIEILGVLIKCETPITSLTIPSNIATISSGSVLDASLAKLTVNTAITNNITVRASIDELVIAPSATEFSNDLNSNTIGKLTIEDGETSLTTTQFKGVIKELYLGRNVSESTFAGLTSLEKVSISDKATSIEQSTFSGCSGMSELNIAESETELTIGDDAFSNVKPTKAYLGRNISSAIFTDNTNLSDLTIGENVTAINDSEFKGCTELSAVTLPNNITTIGSSAFNGCTGLASLLILSTATSIGDSAFSGCTGVGELNIAESETELTIGSDAFSNVKPAKAYLGRNISSAIFTDDTNLSDLTIGDKVTSINNSEFSGCTRLTSVIIPNSVTSIGDYAFQSCTELTSVSIPETVTSLGNWTFDKCAKLESVNIPSSVTSIGEHTFGACTGLTSLTIPNSVTSIGNYAFYGCTGVTELNIADSETKLTIGGSAFTNVKPTKAYLGRSISSAIFTGDTNLSDLTIGDKVTAINNSEFKGCTGLTSVIIPNSVTSIGDYAFQSCTELTSVSIPETVTSLGNWTFDKCAKLESVNIPSSITSIGEHTFGACTGLTSLTIPNTVTSIGGEAFYYCTGVTELNIADSETELTIGGSAFTDVKPTKVYLGRNISDAIFTEDTNLSDLTIGDKVTAINDTEFKGCTALTALTIPNTVTSIGASAFSGCTGVAELKFEDGASELTLGDDAFKGVALKEIYFGRQMNFANAPVSALETVEFGENVTSIETGAFKDAKSLLSVTSRNTVPPTTENPFNDDTYLDGTLYVPATAIETYKAAAGWKNFWTVKAIDGISSGVSEIGDNSNAPFSVENGAICVDGDADVRVVSMNGTTVYSGRGETRINLTPGVYIVIMGNTHTKVAVK
jgi:hypothetical protein